MDCGNTKWKHRDPFRGYCNSQSWEEEWLGESSQKIQGILEVQRVGLNVRSREIEVKSDSLYCDVSPFIQIIFLVL